MSRHDADSSAAIRSRSGRPPRSRRAITALVVAFVLAVSLGPVAIGLSAGVESSAVAEPTLVVSDSTVDPDDTETHRVALTDAPDGLAGFEVTLALESDGVATVTDASYPDQFGLTTDPAVSADEQTITVEAVDLDDEIGSGATDVTLATIDVAGTDPGATELRVTEMQVDADGGSAVEPSLESGTVTVGDGGSTAAAAQSDTDDSETDSDSDDTDSVPGFAAGAAIAAIAATATVVLVRRT